MQDQKIKIAGVKQHHPKYVVKAARRECTKIIAKKHDQRTVDDTHNFLACTNVLISAKATNCTAIKRFYDVYAKQKGVAKWEEKVGAKA